MIRKHTRRAAKAAFAIALGVALILGGTVAAATAGDARKQATPIIIGTKNFPEQYILGQLYKQALEAKGFKVAGYKENIGSTELAGTALTSGKITMYPEYVGVIVSVTFGRKTTPPTAAATYALAKRLYQAKGYTLARQTPFQDKDVIAVTKKTAGQYGLAAIADLKKVPNLSLAGFPEFKTRWIPQLGEAVRRHEREVRPAREHLGLHAARQGPGAVGRRLHDRSAARHEQVHAAEGSEEHVRVPARGAGLQPEARRPSSARSSRRR